MRYPVLYLIFILLIFACQQDDHHQRSDFQIPAVTGISMVAPDILCICICAGQVEQHRQITYKNLPGDSVQICRDQRGILREARLWRNGTAIGFLAGPQQKVLTLFERVVGDTLDLTVIDRPESYQICSEDDPNYLPSVTPLTVYRKSKPVNWAEPHRQMALEHRIYLKLPHLLSTGTTYKIQLNGMNVRTPTLSWQYNPRNTLSEAIHVNQVGYRPDDPGKRAFLSIWLGNGGAYAYPEILKFHLIQETSGEIAYSGKIKSAFAATDIENMLGNKNFNKTHVYHLDFADFDIPGTYRVFVENVGRSYPFKIDDAVWHHSFKIGMKGFYHIRSGIELGPPYTDYQRPRSYAPQEVTVYHSKVPLMNTGNGLNALGTDRDNFGNLVAGRTDSVVTDAWGGYHDAGDWDRRIQHLYCTRLQLELLTLFPDYFRTIDLNIPESSNTLPDVLDEALFNLDCYRRLQVPAGGIRGGIEAAAHPVEGETSWLESLPVMAYAPGIWSSYIYAGVAARAAFFLQSVDTSLAEIYHHSALRALNWAEPRFADWISNVDLPRPPLAVGNERSLALLEMYCLTGEAQWHTLFLENSCLTNPAYTPRGWNQAPQLDAVFRYTQLPLSQSDPQLRARAIQLACSKADSALAYQNKNAFNLTSTWTKRPLMVGFFSTPDAVQLCRAHFLTGEKRYLKGLVRAVQYTAGANPNNVSYTVGLGKNWLKNIMHIDSRLSGQPTPTGLTAYGQFDIVAQLKKEGFIWPIKYFLNRVCMPNPYEWPVNEALWDVYRWPIMLEWTPFQTMGPLTYLWGYLAARE